MGTKRDARGARYQGVSRLDPRWTNSRVRALGANPYDSDYTQQGNRAGIPEAQETSSLALKSSGPQGTRGDLELRTSRAGHPLPDAAAALVRDHAQGDSASQYLGHDGYQVITGWDGSIRYETAGGISPAVPVIRLLNGDLLLVEYDGNRVTHKAWRMDADTGVWANVNTSTLVPGSSGLTEAEHALLQLPSGRVLYFFTAQKALQVHVRYSDDNGTTWASYATAVLSRKAEKPIEALAVAYTRGTVVLFTTESRPAALGQPETGQQWASHDLGCSFSAIGVDWLTGTASPGPQERPSHVNLVGLLSGQVGMLYWWMNTAGTEAYSFRLLDPATPGYTSAKTDLYTATTAPAFAESACAMWDDEDGTLYALLELKAAAPAYTQLLRSLDGGASWKKQKSPSYFAEASGTQRPTNYRVASTGGRAAWVMRWTSSEASSPESLGVAYLGGHTRATVASVGDGTEEYDSRSFLGWGREEGTVTGDARWGGCWLPLADPASSGWTVAGAGADAMVTASKWQVTTTGNERFYSRTDAASRSTIRAVGAGFLVKVVSGGALTTPIVGIRLRLSDYDQPSPTNATFVNEVLVNLTTTGFRVYDSIAGVQRGGDVTYDLTEPTWIQVSMQGDPTQGQVAIWYGRPGGPARRLLVALTSFAFTSDHGANPTHPSRVQWGNIATGWGVSQWEVVGFNFSAHAFRPKQAENFVSSWTNPADLRGREFSTLPALLLDRVKVQATDGPTRLSESWRIKARHDYGVSNLDPRLSPSPRVPWRSVDDSSTARIVWDLEGGLYTDAYLGNHALLFLLLGCNFKTAYIKAWDVAGTAWVTLATLDASAGFSGLPWRRAGSTVRPDLGTAGAGKRYLWRHQHAGDTLDLNTGEAPVHKIQTNTEGAWKSDGSGAAKTKQPTVWLEKDNLTAGTSASGVAAEIWCRDFGAVVREYAGVYERFCLEIPPQSTVDGFFQIGTFFAGDILPFAQQYDLGWVRSREWNVDLQQWLDGTRSVRVLGPRRRSVELGWVETAVQAHQEQADNPDPDYLSSGTTGLPIASRGDVLRALEGLLEQQGGPSEPLVYLSRIPEQPAGTTDPLLLTDRRRWLYGRVQTDPKRETLAARSGEAVDEVERLNRITIEEEV
jgi:hypothetical protein